MRDGSRKVTQTPMGVLDLISWIAAEPAKWGDSETILGLACVLIAIGVIAGIIRAISK